MSDEEELNISNDEVQDGIVTSDNINEDTPGDASETDSNVDSQSSKKTVRTVHYRAPLIIAACIFLSVLIFFGVWKCFFDTDIVGTWGIEISLNTDSEKVPFNLTFEKDKTVRFHSGGVTYIGRYELTKDDNDDKLLYIYLSVYGQVQVFRFNYDIEGNILNGRNLKLVDLSGMLLSPDDSSSDKEYIENKKKITDSVMIDGITYYKWNFTPGNENYKISKNDGFKTDKKLVGTWLYDSKELDYSYTMTFNDDGTFEQLAPDVEIHGSYTVKDGVCSTSYYPMNNNIVEQSFDYNVKDGKLTFGSNEFTGTDNKYAYKSETN